MKTAAKTFGVQLEYRLLSFVLGTRLGHYYQISYLMKGHLNTFKCIALYKFELFKLWNNTFQRFIRFKYAKMQKLWNLQNIHHSGFMLCVDTHTHITFIVTKSKPMHKHWTFLKVSQAQESLWLLTTSVWTESPINGMFCRAEWIIGPNILLSMAQKVSWQKRHCTLGCKVITTASLQSDCHLPLGNEAH